MILQWEQFIRKSFVAEETLPTYTINFTGWMIRWSNRYHCPYLWIIANNEFDVQVPSIEQDIQNHIEFFTINGVPYKWYPLHHGELQLIFFVTHQRPRASSIILSIGGFELGHDEIMGPIPIPSRVAKCQISSHSNSKCERVGRAKFGKLAILKIHMWRRPKDRLLSTTAFVG